MSMQVKYKKTGHIGTVSDKVAEILEIRGEVEIMEVVGNTDKADKVADKPKRSRS